jgi:coproporphyrinogen III oxidase-like Fe-S oxidoreductase
MESKGRKRYEISNFATQGHESIHNLIYWENATYAGVGAGAHGYVDGIRYSNIGPIAKYMEKTALGERPVQQTHVVTATEAMEEEMFLGLRKSNGVSVSLFQEKFGQSLEEVYGETLHLLIKDGLVERLDDAVKLTHRGVYRGNDVFQQFLK